MELLSEYIDAYLSTLKYLDEVVSEPAADYGLSFEQYLIMHSIAQQDGLTLTDVVERRHVTRAAVSRQIKMLLKKEFIYQEPDTADRRRMLLHLTVTGREVEAIVTKRVENRFDHHPAESVTRQDVALAIAAFRRATWALAENA